MPLNIQPIDEREENRLARIEDKIDKLFDGRVTQVDFEHLRTELLASFVLKQVFDVWSSDIIRRMGDVETRQTAIEAVQRSRLKDIVSVGGGAIGAIFAVIYFIIYLIQHIHP